LRDGGAGSGPDSGDAPGSEPGTPESVERSSGAPALRPPGAPTVAKLIFELLVAILQLLDRSGELADLRFEALDAQHLLGGRTLGLFLARGLRLLPEHAADRRQRRSPLLGGGGVRNAKGGNQGRCRKPTDHQGGHREIVGKESDLSAVV
jgi:hypothetical protein